MGSYIYLGTNFVDYQYITELHYREKSVSLLNNGSLEMSGVFMGLHGMR